MGAIVYVFKEMEFLYGKDRAHSILNDLYALDQFPELTDLNQLDSRRGLCHTHFGHVQNIILYSIFETWPDFSGNVFFPVISTMPNFDCYEMFRWAQRKGHMNKDIYGQFRLELYNYTAKVLNQLIDLAKENQK